MLVIEDDEPVRSTLVDILELNGFSIATAANGTAGLASARRERPALIIADGNMPGMTGVELLATFRGEKALRAIPVSVISAKVDRATTRRGLKLGAADFITKPITEEEGLHSIAPRLEKKERMDELDAFAPTYPQSAEPAASADPPAGDSRQAARDRRQDHASPSGGGGHQVIVPPGRDHPMRCSFWPGCAGIGRETAAEPFPARLLSPAHIPADPRRSALKPRFSPFVIVPFRQPSPLAP